MPEYLTISEVAKILYVDHKTVRRWIKGGALEVISLPKVGSHTHYRIPKKALERIVGEPL